MTRLYSYNYYSLEEGNEVQHTIGSRTLATLVECLQHAWQGQWNPCLAGSPPLSQVISVRLWWIPSIQYGSSQSPWTDDTWLNSCCTQFPSFRDSSYNAKFPTAWSNPHWRAVVEWSKASSSSVSTSLTRNKNRLCACAIVVKCILSPYTKRDHDTQLKYQNKLWTNYINLGTGQKTLNKYGTLAS